MDRKLRRKDGGLAELTTGSIAPDFDLPTDGGGQLRLSELRGSPVVLYFYPKDDTSGCTAEAIAFTALEPEFRAEGATVIGISPDSCRSHDRFKEKHKLTVRLASDESKEVLNAYGVWAKKSMYGREYMGVERTTMLLAPDGRIRQIWRKVKVTGHAEEVLEAVKALSVA